MITFATILITNTAKEVREARALSYKPSKRTTEDLDALPHRLSRTPAPAPDLLTNTTPILQAMSQSAIPEATELDISSVSQLPNCDASASLQVPSSTCVPGVPQPNIPACAAQLHHHAKSASAFDLPYTASSLQSDVVAAQPQTSMELRTSSVDPQGALPVNALSWGGTHCIFETESTGYADPGPAPDTSSASGSSITQSLMDFDFPLMPVEWYEFALENTSTWSSEASNDGSSIIGSSDGVGVNDFSMTNDFDSYQFPDGMAASSMEMFGMSGDDIQTGIDAGPSSLTLHVFDHSAGFQISQDPTGSPAVDAISTAASSDVPPGRPKRSVRAPRRPDEEVMFSTTARSNGKKRAPVAVREDAQ